MDLFQRLVARFMIELSSLPAADALPGQAD